MIWIGIDVGRRDVPPRPRHPYENSHLFARFGSGDEGKTRCIFFNVFFFAKIESERMGARKRNTTTKPHYNLNKFRSNKYLMFRTFEFLIQYKLMVSVPSPPPHPLLASSNSSLCFRRSCDLACSSFSLSATAIISTRDCHQGQ